MKIIKYKVGKSNYSISGLNPGDIVEFDISNGSSSAKLLSINGRPHSFDNSYGISGVEKENYGWIRMLLETDFLIFN